uniref:GDP-mannose 4,6-dehydratase n=1 Tax=Lygus hesperus TaxID=30085 RepID=A0A0A9YR94_LYGHE
MCNMHREVRFYQASTSELYGQVVETPQTERTPFYPRSPYAVAKLYAYWICVNYREAYGMHICNGIAFNHESPRRGATFVTRKTTLAVARIVKNLQSCLYLGNIDALRDWGHAVDYVEGMWRILQHDTPTDFVLATNVTMSVRTFVEKAFKYVGITIAWRGSGFDEVGYDVADNRVLVRIDEKLYRPTEVNALIGDASKAKRLLQWEPKISIDEIIADMMDHDLQACEKDTLRW